MIKYYFQMAITGLGNEYLEAEAALIQAGQPAADLLQERIKTASDFDKLVIQVIQQRMAKNETFQAVLDFLDETQRETAPTLAGAPLPEWVADKLVLNFGPRAALLLGVYLNKLVSIWPAWRTMGVILYLGELNSAASDDALIHFTLISPSAHYRDFAVQSLVAVGDAVTLQKIEAHRTLLAEQVELLEQAAEQIRQALGN